MKGSQVRRSFKNCGAKKSILSFGITDPAKFICNALAPAGNVRVIVGEGEKSMEVVVPDDQLSLAIGKRTNVACLQDLGMAFWM
jgi:N utilization substance protein A